MKYSVSKKEISRRKIAYIRLSLSILAGYLVFSLIMHLPLTIEGYLLIIFTLFLLGFYSFRFLNVLSDSHIEVTNHLIIRSSKKSTEEYEIKKIIRVNIKRTVKNNIREIYIWFSDGRSIFISAIRSFEEFQQELQAKMDKNLSILEIREPLDFDHPLFYAFLGFPISGVSLFIMKLLPQMSNQHLRIILSSFSLYLFVLGLYFIARKPLSNRYGPNKKHADTIVSLLLIGTAIMLIFGSRWILGET